MRRFMNQIQDHIEIAERHPEIHGNVDAMKAKFAWLQELDQDELDWQEAIWNGDVDEDWTWNVPEEG